MKITKRKDGYFQTNLYISVDPITGKKKQKTIVSKSKSECRKKAMDFLASVDSTPQTPETENITLSAFIDLYLSDYIVNLKSNTMRTRKSHIHNHILPYFGNRIRLKEITPDMVQKFINGISLNPQTVRNIFGTLFNIFERACSLGFLKTNPAERIQLPKVNERKIRPLTEDELPVFLSALGDDVYSDIIYIDAFTGLRIGEIMALTWDNIDMDRREILVDRAFYDSKKNRTFTTTKNGKSRIVPMTENVFDRLLYRRYTQERERQSRALVYYNPMNLVFTDSLGRRLGGTAIRSKLKKISSSLGFDGLRFHDLRHTYATLNLRAGVDYKTLSESLGHASTAFTMDVYAMVTEGMRQTQAEKLNAFTADF